MAITAVSNPLLLLYSASTNREIEFSLENNQIAVHIYRVVGGARVQHVSQIYQDAISVSFLDSQSSISFVYLPLQIKQSILDALPNPTDHCLSYLRHYDGEISNIIFHVQSLSLPRGRPPSAIYNPQAHKLAKLYAETLSPPASP
jgi:hypothetical protein